MTLRSQLQAKKKSTYSDAISIEIPNTILPHRRDGKFLCLPHQTEGLINEGGIDKWAKGETTAQNESDCKMSDKESPAPPAIKLACKKRRRCVAAGLFMDDFQSSNRNRGSRPSGMILRLSDFKSIQPTGFPQIADCRGGSGCR